MRLIDLSVSVHQDKSRALSETTDLMTIPYIAKLNTRPNLTLDHAWACKMRVRICVFWVNICASMLQPQASALTFWRLTLVRILHSLPLLKKRSKHVCSNQNLILISLCGRVHTPGNPEYYPEGKHGACMVQQLTFCSTIRAFRSSA